MIDTIPPCTASYQILSQKKEADHDVISLFNRSKQIIYFLSIIIFPLWNTSPLLVSL